MYALFEGNKQIGNPFPTEKEVWEAALIEGLVTDVPVADEQGSRLLPAGYSRRARRGDVRAAAGLEAAARDLLIGPKAKCLLGRNRWPRARCNLSRLRERSRQRRG
ncbi:hypothetical protein ABIA43_004983 [Bradyrhizobium sp. USDA 328]